MYYNYYINTKTILIAIPFLISFCMYGTTKPIVITELCSFSKYLQYIYFDAPKHFRKNKLYYRPMQWLKMFGSQPSFCCEKE